MKLSGVFARVDGAIGGSIEANIMRIHRRRLAKIGWGGAYDPIGSDIWAAREPRPRGGNSLEILIDGKEAFASMLAEIDNARSSINITGWHANPHFALDAAQPPSVLHKVLLKAAERVEVRMLLWAGAPIPVFRPSRRDMRKVLAQLSRGGSIKCALDAHERPMHCHHDKTIVIDDRVAYVGGIDVTDFDGDRLDSSAHPARKGVGWHDAAARICGPAVRDVGDHFRLRWGATTGKNLAPSRVPDAAGDVELQVVRTIPDGMYKQLLPRGDFRILESYIRAFRSAQRFIYVENQFLWSPEIIRVLRAKLANPPRDDFRVVLLLPTKPKKGDDDTRGQLSTLVEADDGAGRLVACTLVSPNGARGNPVYVHAKIGIVDDAWMTIGSANLNEHSLFNDSEVNIVTLNERLIRETRERLWSEHLEVSRDDVGGDPVAVVDSLWTPTAKRQSERINRGQPRDHRLTLLPGISKRAGLLLGPLQGLTVDA
jgi:phosphatidylserine/phosphatidylglycerophosphate/cardiolipin synthase-like enzyme